jgi:hypothetical protein
MTIRISRLRVVLFCGAASVLLPIVTALHALAQEPAQKPVIDPAAIAVIEAMASKLATAKSLQVNALGQFDVATEDGQPVYYMTSSKISLQRPDKLKVSILGDGPKSEFVYDGKTIGVFMPAENVVASADAPATIEAMLDKAYDEAGIYFPFVDFIVADPLKSLTDGLNSAFIIGQSELVGGTTTDMVAIANDDLQAQIWIGSEDKLPRLIWISPTQGHEESRHSIEFTDWQLDAPVADGEFVMSDAGKATKIEMARPESFDAEN